MYRVTCLRVAVGWLSTPGVVKLVFLNRMFVRNLPSASQDGQVEPVARNFDGHFVCQSDVIQLVYPTRSFLS